MHSGTSLLFEYTKNPSFNRSLVRCICIYCRFALNQSFLINILSIFTVQACNDFWDCLSLPFTLRFGLLWISPNTSNKYSHAVTTLSVQNSFSRVQKLVHIWGYTERQDDRSVLLLDSLFYMLGLKPTHPDEPKIRNCSYLTINPGE